MRNRTAAVTALVLVLAGGGVASADVLDMPPWANLSYLTTQSNSENVNLWNALNTRGFGERWILDWGRVPSIETNPYWLAFDLGEGNSATVSYVRMNNYSDDVTGTFSFHLEYLPANAGFAEESWLSIPGTDRTVGSMASQQFNFAPIDARAIRWVLTETTRDYRFSKFDIFQVDQLALNLANMPGATLTWSTDPDSRADNMGKARNGDLSDRFDSHNGQPQFVTLILPTDTTLAVLRMATEDNGKSVGLFSIEYLLPDNETWATVPGLGNLTGQPNFAEYDLTVIPTATTGLRLNITDPSTNTGDHQLRLWEFEVFAAVPEPATMALLALGGLAMLRRRR